MDRFPHLWKADGLPPTTGSDGPTEYGVLVNPGVKAPGLMMFHINGNGADLFRGMNPLQAGEFVQREFERIRPAARGKVRLVHVHDWTNYRFCHGHIACFLPGDIGRFANTMGQPVGRLYFAGEHLGRRHLGLEAACESSQEALMAIKPLSREVQNLCCRGMQSWLTIVYKVSMIRLLNPNSRKTCRKIAFLDGDQFVRRRHAHCMESARRREC